MQNSYKIIFTGYVLLALKIINNIIFQLFGLLGYLLISFGLTRLEKTKETKLASIGAFGLFLLTGLQFVSPPLNPSSSFNIVIAVIQLVLYVYLNWMLIYYMFDDITNKFKSNKQVNDANHCQKKKSSFMSLLVYSVICQNLAFLFPKLGAIIFLIGTIMAIYLSFAQAFYMKKVVNVLKY